MQLDKASSRLTTFWGPDGKRYKWLLYPFELSTAPEDFQRALMETLRGLKVVAVVADNILVYGRGYSEEEARVEHDQNLECLLERARASNLKFKPEKLRLHERQVTYMGHVLSVDGLKVDPHKFQVIQDMQQPITVKDMQCFLGMDTTWVWDFTQQQAFVNVKTAVSTTPVLQYYDPREPVELHVDVSQSGLGAALLHNGQPKPLLSTPKHLQYIRLKLQQYDITFKYKKDKEMYLTNTMSRAPVQEDLNQVHDSDKEFIMQLQNTRMHQHLNVSHMTLGRIQLCTTASGVLGERLVVPQEIRAEMPQKAHASHQGLGASLCKVQDTLYWPCMKDEVGRKVSSCTICQEFSAGQPHMKMQTHEVPDLPRKRVAADVFQVYNKQYLILTDYYLYYWEIDALSSTDSAAIIKVMKDFQHAPSSPTGKWEIRSICENSKEHYKEMPANQVRPVARITGVTQQLHVRFEDICREKKQKYKSHYDRKARDLPKIMIGQEVYIKLAPKATSKSWSQETITQQLSSCSYEAITKEGTRVRQNREALLSANSRVNTPIEDQTFEGFPPNQKINKTTTQQKQIQRQHGAPGGTIQSDEREDVVGSAVYSVEGNVKNMGLAARQSETWRRARRT
ncbi:hypothetical protein PR048_015898 [Dryococelus australis]|uniref:RNA-directed DNA polymerase n=1 Tax=Dryococelus australis TaxID=614101 RepID=A0ABQ9HI76_9NEOP|nr:hypothetical protein PR048_015898 [Dryococelus australis]